MRRNDALWYYLAAFLAGAMIAYACGCVPLARPAVGDAYCGQVGRVAIYVRDGAPLSCADARGAVYQALHCGGGKCYEDPLRLDRDWRLTYTPGWCGMTAQGPLEGATYSDGRMCVSLQARDYDLVVRHEVGHALCLAYQQPVNEEACRVR